MLKKFALNEIPATSANYRVVSVRLNRRVLVELAVKRVRAHSLTCFTNPASTPIATRNRRREERAMVSRSLLHDSLRYSEPSRCSIIGILYEGFVGQEFSRYAAGKRAAHVVDTVNNLASLTTRGN